MVSLKFYLLKNTFSRSIKNLSPSLSLSLRKSSPTAFFVQSIVVSTKGFLALFLQPKLHCFSIVSICGFTPTCSCLNFISHLINSMSEAYKVHKYMKMQCHLPYSSSFQIFISMKCCVQKLLLKLD